MNSNPTAMINPSIYICVFVCVCVYHSYLSISEYVGHRSIFHLHSLSLLLIMPLINIAINIIIL